MRRASVFGTHAFLGSDLQGAAPRADLDLVPPPQLAQLCFLFEEKKNRQASVSYTYLAQSDCLSLLARSEQMWWDI